MNRHVRKRTYGHLHTAKISDQTERISLCGPHKKQKQTKTKPLHHWPSSMRTGRLWPWAWFVPRVKRPWSKARVNGGCHFFRRAFLIANFALFGGEQLLFRVSIVNLFWGSVCKGKWGVRVLVYNQKDWLKVVAILNTKACYMNSAGASVRVKPIFFKNSDVS